MVTHPLHLQAADIDSAVDAAIQANDMRLVARIDGQEKAVLIGRQVPLDRIYEVFRPDYAVRVWEAFRPAGIDIPLRLHVFANPSGERFISYRKPSEVFAPYQHDGLLAIGEELDPVFAAIVADIANP